MKKNYKSFYCVNAFQASLAPHQDNVTITMVSGTMVMAGGCRDA